MKVKRFTLLLLLLALTVALLVACDADATTTAGSACPYHGYDRQGDGVCDNCGEPYNAEATDPEVGGGETPAPEAPNPDEGEDGDEPSEE